MEWESIAPWVVLAGLVVLFVWGRRAAKRKANRFKQEGYQAAMAKVAANVTQTVTVSGDDRRSVVVERAAELAAFLDNLDHLDQRTADGVRAWLARDLSAGRRGVGVGSDSGGVVVGLGAVAHRGPGPFDPEALDRDELADAGLRIVRQTEWSDSDEVWR